MASMHYSKQPEPGDDPASDPTDSERQADEARRNLAETKRRAEETLEDAERDLRKRTDEQEATAERLRREARDPTASPPPEPRKGEEDDAKGA
jgi:hypothetical protein